MTCMNKTKNTVTFPSILIKENHILDSDYSKKYKTSSVMPRQRIHKFNMRSERWQEVIAATVNRCMVPLLGRNFALVAGSDIFLFL